jgi:hypothetical protein
MESFLTWLTSLPTPLAVVALVLAVVALMIIKIDKIKETLSIKIRKKTVKRTCTDCIMILFHKKEEYMKRRTIIEKHIIPNQKTFFKQKLHQIELSLLNSYREDISKLRKEQNVEQENKDFTIYKESLKNALYCVDKEIDRAFEENGFHNVDDFKFQIYVKNMCTNIINIAREYLMNAYPTSGMIVPLEYRFANTNMSDVINITVEVFMKAKEIRIEANKEIEALDVQYQKDLDDFIAKI